MLWDNRAPLRNPFVFGASHWGQAKLLLTEIDFLCRVRRDRLETRGNSSLAGTVLVYAGAAPGLHLPVLMELFQDIDAAVLYDPQPITATFEGSRVTARREMFTVEVAERVRQEFPEADILLVSDIRNGSDSLNQFDINVVEDMALQQTCLERLRAAHSLFKFRLPYTDPANPRVWDTRPNATPDTLTYLDGEVWLQPFAATWSTETRLYVKRQSDPENPYPSRLYDCAEYEQQCFAFNCGQRRATYNVPVEVLQRVFGADRSYDVARAAEIARQYLQTCSPTATDAQVARFLSTMFLCLWRSTNRSLFVNTFLTMMADRLETQKEWRNIVSTYRMTRQSMLSAAQAEHQRLLALFRSQRATLLPTQSEMVQQQIARLTELRAGLESKIMQNTRSS